ncbi:MAG: hypothetical protein HQL54_04675 [Magnetococcales bacterium]|nr:hypothetical protein [Magnetococcales bacterium]
MSLINDMLKDLAQRRAGSKQKAKAEDRTDRDDHLSDVVDVASVDAVERVNTEQRVDVVERVDTEQRVDAVGRVDTGAFVDSDLIEEHDDSAPQQQEMDNSTAAAHALITAEASARSGRSIWFWPVAGAGLISALLATTFLLVALDVPKSALRSAKQTNKPTSETKEPVVDRAQAVSSLSVAEKLERLSTAPTMVEKPLAGPQIPQVVDDQQKQREADPPTPLVHVAAIQINPETPAINPKTVAQSAQSLSAPKPVAAFTQPIIPGKSVQPLDSFFLAGDAIDPKLAEISPAQKQKKQREIDAQAGQTQALQAVQPEPQPVQPEPQPVQPEPQPVQPEPQPVQPEPQLVQPEPQPVQLPAQIEQSQDRQQRLKQVVAAVETTIQQKTSESVATPTLFESPVKGAKKTQSSPIEQPEKRVQRSVEPEKKPVVEPAALSVAEPVVSKYVAAIQAKIPAKSLPTVSKQSTPDKPVAMVQVASEPQTKPQVKKAVAVQAKPKLPIKKAVAIQVKSKPPIKKAVAVQVKSKPPIRKAVAVQPKPPIKKAIAVQPKPKPPIKTTVAAQSKTKPQNSRVKVAQVESEPQVERAVVNQIDVLEKAVDFGQLDSAILMIEQLDHSQTAQVSEPLLRQLGHALSKARRYGDVVFVMDQFADQVRHSPELTTLQARILVERGLDERALDLLTHVEGASVRTHIDHYALLAATLYRVGQYGPAGDRYESLLSVHDPQPTWWLGLAMARDNEGETASAIRAYQRVLRMKSQIDVSVQQFVSERLNDLER